MTQVDAVDNILPILWAIARKDILAASQDNKAYMTGELDALIRNDTWYSSSMQCLSGLTYARWTEVPFESDGQPISSFR
jgi:hypothetical protein